MNTSSLINRMNPSTSFARALKAKDSWYGSAAERLWRERTDTEILPKWRLSIFSGRFGEISGNSAGASLSLVFQLVLEAQKQGEPVAWITSRKSTFFPPDAADAGIDLSALAVIRAPDTLAAARATEHLLRSGAFGLVVMDLGAKAYLPIHVQARLAGQARQHDTALLCITEKESNRPSLGSLVSLRAHTARTQKEKNRFRCEAHILKDKRRGPGWEYVEVYRGPDGLR
jgi:recombination protein RecA